MWSNSNVWVTTSYVTGYNLNDRIEENDNL